MDNFKSLKQTSVLCEGGGGGRKRGQAAVSGMKEERTEGGREREGAKRPFPLIAFPLERKEKILLPPVLPSVRRRGSVPCRNLRGASSCRLCRTCPLGSVRMFECSPSPTIKAPQSSPPFTEEVVRVSPLLPLFPISVSGCDALFVACKAYTRHRLQKEEENVTRCPQLLNIPLMA